MKLNSSQHYILFTSQKVLNSFEENIIILPLGSNLRSTSEIINFSERLRLYGENHGGLSNLPCKPATNFHGQKPDIRICKSASDFISKSVLTIEEYLQTSRGLDFLPVINLMTEAIGRQLISELRRKHIHTVISESLYSNVDSEYQSNDVPPVRLFLPHEIEGMEFAISVNLCFDDSSEPHIAVLLYTSITRACAKLVMVVCTISGKLYRKKARIEGLETTLSTLTNTNGVAVLVGINSSFNFMTEMSESELKSKNIDLPEVKGVKYFKGTNEVVILQMVDVYKRDDLEELIRVGLKRLVVVGNNHTDTLQYLFYCYTESILSEKYSHQFEVLNQLCSHALQYFGVMYFLKQRDSDNISEQFIFNKKQVLDGFQNDEPWCKWENWQNKANECCRLGMPFSYFLKMSHFSHRLLNITESNHKYKLDKTRKKKRSLGKKF